jgi:hypothetical protein
MKDLNELTGLEVLDLSHTQVTDAGLAQLKGLKKLNSLYLRKTRVTDAGVKQLTGALPGLRVETREDTWPITGGMPPHVLPLDRRDTRPGWLKYILGGPALLLLVHILGQLFSKRDDAK